jgi:Uma2 family endonuclease
MGFGGMLTKSRGKSTMKVLVLDTYEQKRLIGRRRSRGIDKPDEVWDGTYIVFPPWDNEHQLLRGLFAFAITQIIGRSKDQKVYCGINVSDRRESGMKNIRCPDVAVYLPDNPAEDCATHYRGGPDFAIEIISRNDRARKKLDFYAKVGVRELLLIDRKPWSLELYRWIDGVLTLVGKTTPDPAQTLTSAVLPISLRLLPDASRPKIEVTQTADARQWLF